jgi:formate dehydrogenase subunit delta
MKTERLVQMGNDIGNFFKAEPERSDAINGIFNHMRKFWEPRMRETIIKHLDGGGEGMDELVREAVTKLKSSP